MSEYRMEHDTMGEVRVPKNAKWAAQTQRAVENFPISGIPIDPALLAALAAIKGAVAAQNAKRRTISKAKAAAIEAAAAEVVAGNWNDEFPIDVYQTGSGTSSNMNMNEVLATLASERLNEAVHPNDDVNAPLSSNDMFPAAIHIAAAMSIQRDLLPALRHLAAGLRKKAKEFAKVVKSGRTHLMDATPVTLGQEFGGYAAQIEQAIERLEAVLPRVGELPLGGSAVGTGLNVPKGFAAAVIAKLATDLGLPLTEARDHFAAQSSRDALVEASGQLRTVAVALIKIANDLRWMGSGPRTGLSEIFLPDLQPGSSIMPGKVNPVIPEAVTQVGTQVFAQRLPARDGAQPARVDPTAGQCEPRIPRQVHRRHRGQRRTVQGLRGVVAVDRHVAHPVYRLRKGGRGDQGVDEDGTTDPRPCARAELADRCRTRQGARRACPDQGRRHQVERCRGRRLRPARASLRTGPGRTALGSSGRSSS
jgi:fumarate hydratase class II